MYIYILYFVLFHSTLRHKILYCKVLYVTWKFQVQEPSAKKSWTPKVGAAEGKGRGEGQVEVLTALKLQRRGRVWCEEHRRRTYSLDLPTLTGYSRALV